MNSIAVGLTVVIAIAILEIVLSARWNIFYFTVGLPIFWRRVDRVMGLQDVSLEELLQVTWTVAGTPLLFRRLAPDVIAFREKAFGGSIHFLFFADALMPLSSLRGGPCRSKIAAHPF